LLLCSINECQWGINHIWSRITKNPRTVWRHQAIMVLLAAFVGKNIWHYSGDMSKIWASMVPQQLLALHLESSRGCVVTWIHNGAITHYSWPHCYQWDRNYALKRSIEGASTVVAHASAKIKVLFDYIVSELYCRIPFQVKMLATTL